MDHSRVMCDLMWRSVIKKQPEMFNFITWEEVVDICDLLEVPKVEKVFTEMKDFEVFAEKVYKHPPRFLICVPIL